MRAALSALECAAPDRAPGSASHDRILVARAQAGERAAFDQLVIRHRSAIIKWMMRYTHNLADAEDAAQEAFISAYRGLPGFRGESAFLTWLYRIAVNAVTTRLQMRARDRLMFVSRLPDESGGDLSTALADYETPEDLALTDDVRTLVSDTLRLLPDAYRIAIILREVSGLSYREIAAEMSTPVGTVRSRMSRARDIVDQRLRTVTSEGIGLPGRRRTTVVRASTVVSRALRAI